MSSLFKKFEKPSVRFLLNTSSPGADAEHLQTAVDQALEQQKPFDSMPVQKWLNTWVEQVYAADEQTPLPPLYGVSASQAAVALMEKFNAKLQEFVAQYPPDYQRNDAVAVMTLARAVVAWQEMFEPDPQDWLNFRTNLGLYQKQHVNEWQQQFDSERPSLLQWLHSIPKVALNYEADEHQLKSLQQNIRQSDNAVSRFWSHVLTEWRDLRVPLEASIGLQLQAVHEAISTTHLTHAYGDTYPLCFEPTTTSPWRLPVPVRDYHKGWDAAVRKMGLEYSQERAKTHFPGGVKDTVSERTHHLKLIDDYYQQFERALEPWRWDGLKQASTEEKAQVYAWTTNWAPEYHWDTLTRNMGIYPPVESCKREDYTGKSTSWWLNAPQHEKVVAAKDWISQAELTMSNSIQEGCNMDEFVSRLT